MKHKAIVAIILAAVVIVGGGFVWVNSDIVASWMRLPGAKSATVVVIPQPGDDTSISSSCPTVTNVELEMVGLDAINTNVDKSVLYDVNIFKSQSYGGGQTLSTDQTITIAPGKGYAMYFTPTGGSTSYFGDIVTGNAGCVNDTVNFVSATVGTASFVVTNSTDKLVNSSTNKLAIGAGENVSCDLEIKQTTNDRCLGSPSPRNTEPLKLCVDFNSTALKAPIVKYNGTDLPFADTPAGHSSIREKDTNSQYLNLDDTKCFKLPVTSICDYTTLTGLTLELEAKAGVNPGVTNTSDLNFQLYMPQVFKPLVGDWAFYDSDPINSTQIITPLTGAVYLS